MAFRTWRRLLLTALAVSVLAGAGQLGIAYGFGVVRLDGAFGDGSVNRWPAQLVWVGWFAAIAAVAGAVLTERLARRDGFPGGTTEQLAVAGTAALGATVVAPLCMQSARAAELGGTVDPVWAVGICAVLGALVGAGASIAVLLKPPFGWNIVLTAAVVWLLALLSVAPAVASARPLRTVRLGVLEASWLDAEAAQRLAMLILPAVALLAGAAVGALARRRGHPPLVGGAAGAAGPVLLAFAYLTAGPGDATDRYQLAPYYGALIAVAAGALGSAATTVLRRPATEAGSDAIEPTDILQPLPPSPAIPGPPDTPSPALGTGWTPDGTAGTPAPTAVPGPGPAAGAPGRTRLGPGQREAGGPTPAHWDWPAPAGGTPASAPAGRAHWDEVRPGPEIRGDDPVVEGDRTRRPDEAAPPGRFGSAGLDGPVRTGLSSDPDADEAPVTGRNIEDPGRSLPVPGVLPPGRRTAAIDVLAAGRPVEPAGPARTEPLQAAPAGRRDSRQRDTAGPRAGRAEPSPAPSASEPAPTARSRRRRPASPPTGTTRGGDPGSGSAAGAGPAQPDAPATETPAADLPAPAEPRPAGRSKRPRKGRTTPAATGPRAAATPPADPGPPGADPTSPATTDLAQASPVSTSAAEAKPASASPAGPADSAAGSPAAPVTEAPHAPDGTIDGPTREQNFFFDPGPADTPASPRPRFPIFEDVSDGPGSVRPAWPIAPASSRPVNRRVNGDNPDGATGDDGTPAGPTPAEPAPRPRHRALPDLGRSAAWDALATARHATAGEEGPPVEEDGRHSAQATAPTPAGDDPGTGEPATGAGPATGEPGNGRARQRRGLFRRNRAKEAEAPAAEALAQDEEYVDWVTALASDDNPEATRTLRTGRHHRK